MPCLIPTYRTTRLCPEPAEKKFSLAYAERSTSGTINMNQSAFSNCNGHNIAKGEKAFQTNSRKSDARKTISVAVDQNIVSSSVFQKISKYRLAKRNAS